MKITSVDQASTAAELGLQDGDEVVRVNGERVRDILDYRYLISDELVELEVKRQDDSVIYEIEKDIDDSLGLNFEPIKMRRCGNDCIFCFVDQNPAGMRSGMYFRDEDFRLSFLSGHYVTLSNISHSDLKRVVRQRLTPLFISVHATDPDIRKFLLGIKFDDRLVSKIEFLTENGISLNTQIVLCPKINDGEVLQKTIADLAHFYPEIRSVAVVPVGLTQHRKGLTKIESITKEYAKNFLDLADRYAAEWQERLGSHFVYPSDEFYIIAGESIPPAERYDAFDQKENGVGMLRDLLNHFHDVQIPQLPKTLSSPVKITFVTATLAGDFLNEHIMHQLRMIKNFTPNLVTVRNKFYGESITITGLLTAQDIYRTLQEHDLGEMVVIPESCINDKKTFLDDWKITELQKKLGVPVIAIKNDFSKVFDFIQ